MFTTRALRVLSASFVLSALCACGGGGPDTGGAGERFIKQVNLEAEGKAKLVSFGETSRKFESVGDIEGCTVTFAGEVEFTDRCFYYLSERKAGDRMQFEANIEYGKEDGVWKEGMAGITPR